MEIISAVCKQRFFSPQLLSCADVLIRYCLCLKVSSSPLTEGWAQVAATNHLLSVQQVETFVHTWLWRMPLPPVKTKPLIPKLEEQRVLNQCCTWFEFLLEPRGDSEQLPLGPPSHVTERLLLFSAAVGTWDHMVQVGQFPSSSSQVAQIGSVT